MIRLAVGNLKSGRTLWLALSLAAPNYLIAQQPITPAAALLPNDKPSATKPGYDVASIRPGKWAGSGSISTGIEVRNDSFIAREMSLASLVANAYAVRSYQVSGGPAWAREDFYDVTAKMDESAAETLGRMAPRQAELVKEQMLEALLADRFKLTIHHETKQLPLSALVVSKGGLKIQPTGAATTSPDALADEVTDALVGADDHPNPNLSIENENEGYLITAQDYSMDLMANWLESQLGHPVKNMTALPGNYNFKLHYSPEMLASDASSSSSASPVITTAIQDQLGLKLEWRKGAVDVIVIDRVERPSAN